MCIYLTKHKTHAALNRVKTHDGPFTAYQKARYGCATDEAAVMGVDVHCLLACLTARWTAAGPAAESRTPGTVGPAL